MEVKLTHLQQIYGVPGAREKFEELTAHLIRSERPDAERIRIFRGDGGIDVHEGALSNPAGVDVYQMKFFPDGLDDSQKAQIRDSFHRAAENKDFRMKTWTLCLPIDMSIPEKKWFDEWKATQQQTGIEIRLWSALHLEGLLYSEKNRHLREVFFSQVDRRPLKIVRTFPASIVFNESDNLPQVFFDMDSDIGQRLASKSSVACPYQNIDGKAVLMVQVPITDGQKFLHGVDALQGKMLADICSAQRGGSTHGWSANTGVIPTKITTPNTPEPITLLSGSVILDALAENRFAQNPMTRLQFEYSHIPFPDGTSIRLEARPSRPGVGPEQRRVVVAVPGKATIVVSVEPLPAFGAGALPQGASVPGGALKYCRTFTFSVRVDAEIIRSGNHEDVIQDYKAWIEWLASELQSHNAD